MSTVGKGWLRPFVAKLLVRDLRAEARDLRAEAREILTDRCKRPPFAPWRAVLGRGSLRSLSSSTKGKPWRRRGLICTLTQAGTFLMAPRLRAQPTKLELDLPTLRYPGNWQPYKAVMQSLGSQLRLRTRINAKRTPSIVDIRQRGPLFDTPFLYVAGDEALPPLSNEQASDLRRFVDFGGLLVFDDASGGTHHAFKESVNAWVKTLLPSSKLAPLPNDHVLFRSFYVVKRPSGRRIVSEHCLAVQEEGRIKVLYLPNDLGGALARNSQGFTSACVPGGDLQREWALRFAVNLLLYATCTDYKSDPAHVQTLLRRRQWQ